MTSDEFSEWLVFIFFGAVAVSIVFLALRSGDRARGDGPSSGEKAMNAFGGGPLRLTPRALALWLGGIAIGVLAYVIARILA